MQYPDKNIIISVIIPAYNYGRYIGECLDSVLAQTFKNWECIVVDNGSTDDTAAIVKDYAAKDRRISYHFTEEKGVSFARNRAVELSKGYYIFPLDADDKIAATCLEKSVKVIESNNNIKVVYSDAELFGTRTGKWILPEYSFRGLLIENSIFCTALYRRTDFDLAKGFNEDMKEGFEDWDFWIRMLKNGGEVVKIEETLFYYRMRADSRNGALDKTKQMSLRRQIFKNHRAVYEKYFTLPDLVFENYNLKLEIDSINKSTDLKTGRIVLKPLRFIKQFFSKGK